MATSVARASSLWKRSPSPMTCFQRANWPSTRALSIIAAVALPGHSPFPGDRLDVAVALGGVGVGGGAEHGIGTLTADPPDRARRLFAAAEAAWLAGHAERADERLADARASCEDPALRVEIDHLRGHAALRAGRRRGRARHPRRGAPTTRRPSRPS